MATRLTTLPARLSAAPARIGRAADKTRTGSIKRDRSHAPWRGWYNTKRWHDLRIQVFERDGYICQRSGILCAGKHPAPDSPTANHRVRHNGDPVLFWDPSNVETITKQVHDTLIQQEEQASIHQRGDWG